MAQAATAHTRTHTACYHCGEDCGTSDIHLAEKPFCCEGCKTVYEILNENGFADYYNIEQAPGITMRKRKAQGALSYLDHPDVVEKLVDFRNDSITRITFNIPQIHCASCIWLLENLYRLKPGITGVKVNFLKREAALTFTNAQLTLRSVVELLASIGYEPEINLQSLEGKTQKKTSKEFYYQLGVAGFCFGNIMLLSFPEYLAINRYIEPQFTRFFSYLNLLLALPVFFYCSSYYFKAAFRGLQAKMLDINVPVALGIFTLFTRSAYEVLTQTGAGYFDSMAGLVFFLLIGKWFQNKTYDSLSFDRDYKSYFPVSATRKVNDKEENIPLNEIKIGDVLLIRNGELVPADAELVKGEGQIDYSFVTGESNTTKAHAGEKIYAGGRQAGGAIEIKVLKNTSQSYLTQLWNQEVFAKQRQQKVTAFINTFSTYFTPAALLTASIAGGYWLVVDSSLAMNVFTSVLIVVCACALALATPFTLGNAMRILGKNNFYLKDTSVIESLAQTDEVVFDKTGTLTNAGEQKARFVGELSENEKQMAHSLAYHSSHPLSRQIYDSLEKKELLPVKEFKEYSGKGIEGIVQKGSERMVFPLLGEMQKGNSQENDSPDSEMLLCVSPPEAEEANAPDNIKIQLGSEGFVKGMHIVRDAEVTGTRSWLAINGKVKGYFEYNNHYREGLAEVIHDLENDYNISLLTGDGEGEKEFLKTYFNENNLHFSQSPQDKLNFIRFLENHGKRVLMIGDGLNDAGALKQSSTGISITESVNNFSPSCDAILDAQAFHDLPKLIRFSKGSMTLLKAALGISLLYNVFALTFAVQGAFTPIVAAILMPLSSITVTAFGIASTTLLAKRNGLKIQ